MMTEKGEQFVQLDVEKLHVGHRLKISVQAVDYDDRRFPGKNILLYHMNKFAGSELGRVNRDQSNAAAFDKFLKRQSDRLAACEQRASILFKTINKSVFAATCGCDRILNCNGGFPRPCRTEQQCTRPSIQAATQEYV